MLLQYEIFHLVLSLIIIKAMSTFQYFYVRLKFFPVFQISFYAHKSLAKKFVSHANQQARFNPKCSSRSFIGSSSFICVFICIEPQAHPLSTNELRAHPLPASNLQACPSQLILHPSQCYPSPCSVAMNCE